MHFHRKKDETFLVDNGPLHLVREINGKEKLTVHHVGEKVRVRAGERHSLQAPSTKNVKLFEVSTYHPDDSVRVKDYYGRKVESV